MPGDPLMTKLAEHPAAFAAAAVVSLAAAYVCLPRVGALLRSFAVRLGLSKSSADKVQTFIRQHSKNMLEAEKDPSYAFSIISCPALSSHSVAVGILPDDSLIAHVKRSSLTRAADTSVRQLAVLSVVEQFELDTEFDYTCAAPPPRARTPSAHSHGRSASGQQKHFKSFISSSGGYKERSVFPCDDYCAVPLPVLHRAADQLHRYLSDGLAVCAPSNTAPSHLQHIAR
jgi:hypothetical protein